MELNKIFKVLEQVAPVSLSERFCALYGAFDNSGIILNCGEDIRGVLFSLDLSKKTVAACKEKGYNLIVTHHPAIYGGVHRISECENGAILQCIRQGISVISMHLNFDCAPRGIDYYLMKGCGGENFTAMKNFEGGSYGRIYSVPKTTLFSFAKKLEKEFSTNRIVTYGEDKSIEKVASFCGAGCDDESVDFAISGKAEAFISSDLKHHLIAKLLESGVAVIYLTHYSAENYGFNQIYKTVAEKLSVPHAYFIDKDLI